MLYIYIYYFKGLMFCSQEKQEVEETLHFTALINLWLLRTLTDTAVNSISCLTRTMVFTTNRMLQGQH